MRWELELRFCLNNFYDQSLLSGLNGILKGITKDSVISLKQFVSGKNSLMFRLQFQDFLFKNLETTMMVCIISRSKIYSEN